MFESEADRLAMIQAVGEQIRTDAGTFWGVYDADFYGAEVGSHSVESRQPSIVCRSSDVASHALIKGSSIVRLSDSTTFLVKRIEDDGTGVTTLVLRK